MANAVKYVNLAARAFQFLWTLLIMSIVGNMIAQAVGGSPSVVNYEMFLAVFGMLSLFYLIPATFVESIAIHPLIMIVLDVLNTLLWFCGAVAIAAELGAHSCSNGNYTASNNVTNGTSAGNRHKRCTEAQAVTAFTWFGFVAFAISAVLDFFQMRSAGATKGSRSSRA